MLTSNRAIARYTQPDPLGLIDGPSVYAYVTNAPQMFVDPDGRKIGWGILIGAAAAKYGKKIYDYAREKLKNYDFDGPSSGLMHGNGRVCGVRYKSKPIFRLDYQPIPGSKQQSRLHVHIGKNMKKHYSIDPRSFND